MSGQSTPCRLGTGAALLLFVLTAAWSWAGHSEVVDPENDRFIPENATAEVAEICFAPGTTLDGMERAYQRLEAHRERNGLPPASFTKYQIWRGWLSTATDGGGLSQGDPITLTWGVVPDGTPIVSYYGEPGAASDLRAFLNGIYGNISVWLPLFQQVFDRWGELTGINYVYVGYDDSRTLPNYAGLTAVRADVRIGGHFIDGGGNVLAYNYFPDTGDMVIDTGDSMFNNTSFNSLLLRNTVAHEHGHGLGIEHVCPINETKLMEPYVSWSFDGPQHDDILGANRLYGDRYENNDTPGTAEPLGAFGSIAQANLSLDDNSDKDVFSFVVDAAAEVDVTLAPTGATYLEGPQNTSPPYACTTGTSYDTLRIQDLEIRVLDVDGSTQLAVADSTGVGGTEVLEGVPLTSGAGTYFVEVTGDSSDAAQLYSLSLTVSPSDQIFSEDFESGDVTGWASAAP